MKRVLLTLSSSILIAVIFLSTGVQANAAVQSATIEPTVYFSGKHLLVQGSSFPIKGANESVLPIGTMIAGPPNGVCLYIGGPPPTNFICSGLTIDDLGFALDQEIRLVRSLGGNTFRTFGKITSTVPTVPYSETLKYARQYGAMVIAGFWMNDANFLAPQVRTNYINEFVSYVNTLRQDPNYDRVLMFGLSNENNNTFCTASTHVPPCNRQQQAAAFYSLVNEMARRAKLGDPDPRPVMVVSAELGDIGTASVNADDASTRFIDAWGVNVYRGSLFYGMFGQYAARSSKPLIVSEFGMDAWDNRGGGSHDPATQANYVGTLWDELIADYGNPNGVSAGGCVFQIVDNWWQANLPNLWVRGVALHESGGWPNPGWPDGQADVEYFGLFERVATTPLFDGYNPRSAAFVTQQKLNQTW